MVTLDLCTIVLVISISISSILVYMKWFRNKDSNHPTDYPIVGHLFALARNKHRIDEYITGLLKASPSQTVSLRRFMGMHVVMTANPKNVEHILRTNFDNYPKGNLINFMVQDLLGKGIFNVDGEEWKAQRKIASHEFNTASLRDFIGDTVTAEIGDRLLPLLHRASLEEKVIDLQDILKRFAFDNICKVAFGMDPECLTPSLPTSEFADAFDMSTEVISYRFRGMNILTWRMKKYFGLGSEKQLRESLAVVNEFASRVIAKRKEDVLVNEQERPDLLSRFLKLDDNHEFVRDMVISFMLAGRDTTSAALTWFFWLLTWHPDVVQSIRKEIREIQRHERGLFSYDELKEMNYLHAALCESMRLYPPVPSDNKTVLKDDVLPDGTAVKGGSQVVYHPYAMGRMESVWGKDCMDFRPERWLKRESDGDKVAFVAESSFKFAVFQAGPRICLGKEMAFMQMKAIAACVVARFDVADAREGCPPRLFARLTLSMVGGLPIRLSKCST